MKSWTIDRKGSAYKLRFDSDSRRDSFHVVLMADLHADNAHSDLDLIRKHFAVAAELNAPIITAGDTFCAMQGKYDPRSDQSQLRPELRGGNYFDRLVAYVADLHLPYAKQFAIIGRGNHETSILNRQQTDLTERLVDRLRVAGSPCLAGGYTGFVRVQFAMAHTDVSASRDLHFHHGYGGGGEVTRGMIDHSRTRGMYVADVHFSGHIHRRNADENILLMLDQGGSVVQRQQWMLRSGCYKAEHGESGWHTEKGRAARPLGGWLLRFDVHRSTNQVDVTITPEPLT